MSNVYYLPVPAASAVDIAGPLTTSRPTWSQALRRAGARVWFAWLELRHALRPPVLPPLSTLELEPMTAGEIRQEILLRDHAALLGVTMPRSAGPARIFDFEAARARRCSV